MTRWTAALLLGGVLSAESVAAQQARSVTGRVLSRSDSLPLSGVRVRLLGTRLRAETADNGAFVLHGVPTVDVRLLFERIGVAPDTVLVRAAQGSLVVYLAVRPVEVSPLIAVGALPARQRFRRLAQTSTVSLEPLEIEAAPVLAEPDVSRAAQLLPGTVAKNDFTVGLNVRGGEADQNLIRLDGTTVFNPFHLGGLFGTFDHAAVDRVDLITGGFPAGFGGRLSSVMDVTLRSGDPRDTRLRGGVSLLASKLLLDGPLGGTGVRYLVGVRRTYADAFVDAFSEDAFSYYFGDAVAKVVVPLATGGTLSTTAYWGRDALVFEWFAPEPGREGVDLEFGWGNRLAGLTLRQPLGPVQWEQHLSISAFSTRFAFVPDVLEAKNSVRQLTARTSFGIRLGPHDVEFGAAVEDHRMVYDYRSNAVGAQLLDLRYRPTVWSAFADAQLRPFGWLLLRPGVRVEQVDGGADFAAVSPRVGLKAFLTGDLAVIASAGRYYQAIHSIRDHEVPVTMFDFWIGADTVAPVARADHLVAGFERWFGTEVSLSVEAYGKWYDDLLLRNHRDDPRVVGDEFVRATGYAWGSDVLLRKYGGTIRGWIAYGLAKTIRRAEGQEFPPAHDRRHTVDIVLQAPGPLGSAMSLHWGYGSPIPYTGIVGQWLHREYNAQLNRFDQWEEDVLGAAINGERFPHYSRLDVGLRWQFEKWGATWRPYVQVINLYNRRNVFVYRFEYDAAPPTRSGYTQLPLLPTVGLEFEW